METMQTRLVRIYGWDTDEPASERKQSGISRVALSVVLAIVVSAAAAVSKLTLDNPAVEGSAMAQQAAAGQTDAKAVEEFEYFPSRYVNQATEIEEHIQAF
jgi:uncharacterized protein YpmB